LSGVWYEADPAAPAGAACDPSRMAAAPR